MRAEIRMSSTGWTFCHDFPSWRAYQLPPHQRISTSSPLLIALCSLNLLHEGCVTRISQTRRTQTVIVAGLSVCVCVPALIFPQYDRSFCLSACNTPPVRRITPHTRQEESHPTLAPPQTPHPDPEVISLACLLSPRDNLSVLKWGQPGSTRFPISGRPLWNSGFGWQLTPVSVTHDVRSCTATSFCPSQINSFWTKNPRHWNLYQFNIADAYLLNGYLNPALGPRRDAFSLLRLLLVCPFYRAFKPSCENPFSSSNWMWFEFPRPSGDTSLLEMSVWMLPPNVTGDVSVHNNERRLFERMQPCRQQT